MTGGRSRKLALALFVSLLANVFLVSVLVAHALLPATDDRASRTSYIDDWRAMADKLPAPHREPALAAWQVQQQAYDASREQRRAARVAYTAALAAEPFDPAALQRAFDDMRAASTSRWATFQAAVLATAPHVPLAERQAYASATEQRWASRDKK